MIFSTATTKTWLNHWTNWHRAPAKLTRSHLNELGALNRWPAHQSQICSQKFQFPHPKTLCISSPWLVDCARLFVLGSYLSSYPLCNAFLPQYLNSRNAAIGQASLNTTMRDNLIVNVSSLFGPIIAGPLREVKFLGRRGTMVIGALLTMVFMLAYTTVRTPAQNLGFSCAINCCLNIYYGTLFAYTPQVLPSAHRATGNGMSVAFAPAWAPFLRLQHITQIPIYVMAALFLEVAAIAACFPYEVRGRAFGLENNRFACFAIYYKSYEHIRKEHDHSIEYLMNLKW